MTVDLISFVSNLIRGGYWVFFTGGFIAIFGLLYKWVDDQWLDNKIGGWFGKQEYVFYRLFPPTVNEKSMGEMEQIFQRLWSIYQHRDPYEVYTEGKWYEGYSFEFHSKGGYMGIFVRVNKKHATLFKSSIEAHLDDVILVEYPDPLSSWPKDWDRKTGRYIYMYGAEMTIMSARDTKPKKGTETDIYQLKSWRDFQVENNKPTSDPASGLFGALSSLDPEEYLVIQFCIKPYFDQEKIAKWKAILQEKRVEFTNNMDTSIDEEGNVTLLTDIEKSILNGMDRKIHSLHYLTKIRFLAFANDHVKQRKAVSLVYSYFVQFDSQLLVMVPEPETVTSTEPKGEKLGLLGPQLDLIVDKIFYERERYFREKCIYQGLLKRSTDIGSAPYFLVPEELAAMIHFPYITKENLKIQNISRHTDPEQLQLLQKNNNLPSIQPPAILPT